MLNCLQVEKIFANFKNSGLCHSLCSGLRRDKSAYALRLRSGLRRDKEKKMNCKMMLLFALLVFFCGCDYDYADGKNGKCAYCIDSLCMDGTCGESCELLFCEECLSDWRIDDFSRHCYKVIDKKFGYNEAEEYCSEKHGSHLVTISSAQENDLVGSIIKEVSWIGLDDISIEGEFVWMTGEPLEYTNWVSGEPNNQSGAEDCANIGFYEAQWNDEKCETSSQFVCEFEP